MGKRSRSLPDQRCIKIPAETDRGIVAANLSRDPTLNLLGVAESVKASIKRPVVRKNSIWHHAASFSR
jgi:hypothetical protein